MINRRAPCFAEIPAYYVDENAIPLFNDRDNLATDEDVDGLLNHPDISDRLIMEMCAYHRARGESLVKWQLDAELEAFQRARKREVA